MTPQQKKLASTAVFVAVVGGVLAFFVFLSQGAEPPNMPAGPQHKLRFNLKGELVGVESDPPVDLTTKSPPGFVYDSRAIAQKISVGCTACHGGLAQQIAPSGVKSIITVPCPGQPNVPCVGEHHPPKNECIKCHVMSAATKNAVE